MESEFRIILGRPRGFLLDSIVPGCEPEYLAITLVFTRKNASLQINELSPKQFLSSS